MGRRWPSAGRKHGIRGVPAARFTPQGGPRRPRGPVRGGAVGWSRLHGRARHGGHRGTGNSVNTEIVVATPTGHSTPGFGTSFCAYHGAVSAHPNVTYTDLPYMTDAGTSCGENSVNGANGKLDGVSIVEGHELAEA